MIDIFSLKDFSVIRYGYFTDRNGVKYDFHLARIEQAPKALSASPYLLEISKKWCSYDERNSDATCFDAYIDKAKKVPDLLYERRYWESDGNCLNNSWSESCIRFGGNILGFLRAIQSMENMPLLFTKLIDLIEHDIALMGVAASARSLAQQRAEQRWGQAGVLTS